MCIDADKKGLGITSSDDERITRFGHFIRRTKLDELPQLMNVIKGDLSIVGPRPEIPIYVQRRKDDYQVILKARPGITDYATVAFRNEQDVLAQFDDKDLAYVQEIMPRKIHLNYNYLQSISFWGDVRIVFQTLWQIVFG